MPMQGFGVFQVPGCNRVRESRYRALATGYRLIDTASVYGNGTGCRGGYSQQWYFAGRVVYYNKAWISEMGYERTLRSFDVSLARLGLDYLDLYLIHMPLGDYYGAWRAMEELYSAGRVRAIGVCNFEPDRLLDLCHNVRVIPAVNQIEMHPYTRQSEAVRIMGELGVQMEAWGPLSEGRNGLFTDEILTGIGRKYGKSAAQVVLRWHLQRGVVAIPKSVHRTRMEENFNIGDFTLSVEDMAAIDAMDTGCSTILDLHAPAEVERLYNIECQA